MGGVSPKGWDCLQWVGTVGCRTNINVLWNTNFCFGHFESYLHKILRQHPKWGKIILFLRFFSAEVSFTELFLVD